MLIDAKHIAKITKTPSWKSHNNLSKTFLRTDHWEIQNWLIIFKKMRSKKKEEEEKCALFFNWNMSCHVIFESTSHFSFKFYINTQYHQTQILCTFYCSNIIYFGQKQPIKVQIFEIFKCSGQNLSNSSCQFWDDSQFLFNFCTILHCHDTQLPCNS